MRRFRMPSKHFLVASLVLFLFACGGGSCAGCAGCGVAPIPGGFPIAERIDNSAQVRLTNAGIGFLESNVATIASTLIGMDLEFPIPRSTTSVAVVGDLTICPDSDCRIRATIRSLDLVPTAPNRLTAQLRLDVKTYSAAGERRALPIRGGFLVGTVRADIDTARGSRDYIGLTINIDLVAETRAARAGYTRINIADAVLTPGEDIENDDITLMGGASWLLNLAKGLVVDQLEGQISGLLDTAIGDQLCTTRGEFGCPTGTFARPNENPDSTCRYENNDAAECVPTLLGTDGQGDLGASFLGGFSPGTHGSGQFLLAAGGDAEAVNEGMSLFFYGGFRSTNGDFTRSPGHNPCVPALTPTSPRDGGGTIADNWGGGERPTIPRVETFRGNTPAGLAMSPHVAVGLSEDYLNYAAFGAFDAGLLCIGAGTRLSQQISTGLFSLLIGSLKNLAFPEEAAALAFSIRPQEPPRVSLGTAPGAPVLGLLLPKVQIDFYVWSHERYVRIFTYQADLNIGIDLSVEGGQIVPMIGELTASNPSVTNSDLITEDPADLADTITTVLGSFAGMLGGSIAPFDLPAIMGFNLNVPEGGLKGVSDSGEDFLGIFANLELAAPAPLSATTETTLDVQDLTLNREAMSVGTFGQGDLPSVRLNMNATGPAGVDFEYSYRVDGMQWSPWTRDRSVVVASSALLLQARHEIEARSRVVGERLTVDTTPARAPLLIDLLAPEVVVEQEGNVARVIATDVITARSALRYRYRTGGTAWTEWTSAATFTLPDGGATGLDVEVQDEAGNVGASRQALIRGLPNAAGDGACNCRVAGAPTGGDFAVFAMAVLFVLGAGRRRFLPAARRALRSPFARAALKHLPVVLVLSAPLGLGAMGCDCGDGTTPPPTPPGTPCDGLCGTTPADGQFCCAETNMCQTFGADADCEPGFTCPPASIELDGCTVRCAAGACMEKPPLTPGQLATHLDMVLDDSGTATLSGYAAGNAPNRFYGDLVVGEYDAASETVDWEIVDGAPSSPVTAGPSGWRGGVSAPGDDVGRFTSLARSSTGTLYVSYYDADAGDLKLAIRSGTSWNTQVVDETGDAGRYSSLVLTPEGVPAVAYMRVEPPATSGRPTSGVYFALASNAAPGDPTEWTISEVVKGEIACRPQFCGAGQTCLANGECVTPSTDCAATCGDAEACVAGSCTAALADPWVEDLPPAIGLHISLARTASGYGLVYYDRSAGNLQGVSFSGSAWSAPFLIDGYAAGSPFIGDSGIGASLVVDAAGKWHVSYVDGAEELLKYARISGTTVEAKEIVDDGSTDGTTPHTDGRHVVGDDSSIVVTAGGEVRIAYQDATTQRVMYATRASAGGWTTTVLDAMDSTGYFVEQVLAGDTSYVATWWRREQGTKANGVRVLNP